MTERNIPQGAWGPLFQALNDAGIPEEWYSKVMDLETAEDILVHAALDGEISLGDLRRAREAIQRIRDDLGLP